MICKELSAAEKADLILAEAKRKAHRIILVGYLVLGLCLAVSIAVISSDISNHDHHPEILDITYVPFIKDLHI